MVALLVGVRLTVTVGLLVGVLVGVRVKVCVGLLVGVLVGVMVKLLVGVLVGVRVAVFWAQRGRDSPQAMTMVKKNRCRLSGFMTTFPLNKKLHPLAFLTAFNGKS